MAKYRQARPKIQILKRGLILCEGETEEKYFKGLVTQDKFRRQFAAISVEIYKPKNHSPRGLVTEARNKMKVAKKDDRYAKGFNKCDDIVAEVKGHLPDYQKATDIFPVLEPFLEAGLTNSKWSLERNQPDLDAGSRPYELSAYSNIHESVNELLDLIKPKAAVVEA